MLSRLIKGVEENGQQLFVQFTPPPAQAVTGSPLIMPSALKGPANLRSGDASATAELFRPPSLNGAAAAPALAPPASQEPEVDSEAVVAAEEMIGQQARERAERIVAEAMAQADAIEREAQARGMAQAQTVIAAETAQAVEPLRQKLTQTLDELTRLRSSIALRAERDLVRLSLEIAKKIVHREVTIDHEIALTLARVALSRIHNRAVATIHLHPDDYNFVAMHQDKFDGNCSIELVEDRSIGRGGCLVSTEMGDVDARIENQFAEIESGLLAL